jgi:hypothetical protein
MARRAINRAVASGKRVIFITCETARRRPKHFAPGCFLVADEFKRPRIRHPTQQRIIETIVRNLTTKNDIARRFFIIEGNSGYGKTRSAFLLVEALLHHNALFDLADRAFYYDFSREPNVQNNFLSRLGGIRHWGALVVVDNFHLAKPQVIAEITKRLLDSPNDLTERFVVILAQPTNAWRLRPGAEIRLVQVARELGQWFELSGILPKEILETTDMATRRRQMERLVALNAERVASIAEMQFAQLEMAVPGSSGNFATDIFDRLDNPTSPLKNEMERRALQALAIASALALYRGSFSAREFWFASKSIAGVGTLMPWLRVCALWRVLIRLSRTGLIPRMSLPGRLFILHEKLAETFRDRLHDCAEYEQPFHEALRWRVVGGADKSDHVVQWLAGCELAEINRLDVWFELALLSGGLNVMLRRLERNARYFTGVTAADFQLAYLLDKNGRFAEARQQFDRLLRTGRGEIQRLDQIRLAMVEAEHGPDAQQVVSEIEQRGDPINALAARYWGIHLGAHKGRFRPDELRALVSIFKSQFSIQQINSSYTLSYLGARIFFDACRHIFLRGENVRYRLREMDALMLNSALPDALPEFQAMWRLYSEAHVIAHVDLPQFSIFGRTSDLGELLPLIGKEPGELVISDIVRAAREAYTRCRNEFAVFGYRESLYLQADILNLDLQEPGGDLDRLRPKLVEYELFIRKTGFGDIASYPHVYWFRWHIANRFRVLETGYPLALVDQHDIEAKKHLERAHLLDAACGNLYGMWRCDFLKTVFDCLGAGDERDVSIRLFELRKKAERLGYVRDSNIIDDLAAAPSLSVHNVRQVLLYYPIVHQ